MTLAVQALDESFQRILPLKTAFAEAFYAELFRRYPETNVLFEQRHADMRRQQKSLMQSLETVLETLREGQTEQLSAMLKASDPLTGRAVGEVEQVLVSAHRVAEEVRVAAEAAAHRTLQEAQVEGAQLRSQAELDAAALASSASARLTELEAQIREMVVRRNAVQALLDTAADRLVQIAQEMRATPLVDTAFPKAAPAELPLAPTT